MNDRADLLQPTLGAADTVKALPYSVGTTFLTGFFGGPFGAILILAVNAVRLRRLDRDLVFLAAVVIAVLAGEWALFSTAAGAELVAQAQEALGRNGMRHVVRLAALLIVGGGYFLHREDQRMVSFRGLTRPDGFWPGLACIAVGLLVQYGFFHLLMR